MVIVFFYSGGAGLAIILSHNKKFMLTNNQAAKINY